MTWRNPPAETGVRLTANPWNYRVNVNHPRMRPLYERFKGWKGVPAWCPLVDEERREFEGWVLGEAEQGHAAIEHQRQQDDTGGFAG